MATNPNAHEKVSKALRRLGTLTYDVKQLINEGRYQEVFDQLKADRHFGDFVLIGLLGLSLFFASQTVLTREIPYVSLGFTAVFAWMLWERRRTINDVHRIVREYSSSEPVGETAKSIGAQIAAGNVLTYEQKQLLKSEGAAACARQLAAQALNWAGLVAGVGAVFSMRMVNQFFRDMRDMGRTDGLTSDDVFVLVGTVGMILLPCGSYAIWQLVRWNRFRKLASRAEMVGEVEGTDG